jgi:hypothetical protein
MAQQGESPSSTAKPTTVLALNPNSQVPQPAVTHFRKRHIMGRVTEDGRWECHEPKQNGQWRCLSLVQNTAEAMITHMNRLHTRASHYAFDQEVLEVPFFCTIGDCSYKGRNWHAMQKHIPKHRTGLTPGWYRCRAFEARAKRVRQLEARRVKARQLEAKQKELDKQSAHEQNASEQNAIATAKTTTVELNGTAPANVKQQVNKAETSSLKRRARKSKTLVHPRGGPDQKGQKKHRVGGHSHEAHKDTDTASLPEDQISQVRDEQIRQLAAAEGNGVDYQAEEEDDAHPEQLGTTAATTANHGLEPRAELNSRKSKAEGKDDKEE